MKYAVEIARLVRETQVVLVEADTPEGALEIVYEGAEGSEFDDRWEADAMWGCEEGTHSVIGPAPKDSTEPEVERNTP